MEIFEKACQAGLHLSCYHGEIIQEIVERFNILLLWRCWGPAFCGGHVPSGWSFGSVGAISQHSRDDVDSLEGSNKGTGDIVNKPLLCVKGIRVVEGII